MDPEKRTSEIATLILGGLGIVLLINSIPIMIDDTSGFGALGGLFILFYQGVIALIALPFLVKSFRREKVMPWFVKFVLAESGANALLVLIQLIIMVFVSIQIVSIQIVSLYTVMILLELIPFIFYYVSKERIVNNII